MPAEQRRDVTVEAVIDLAAKHNPSTITTAAIAKYMNVTQGALFRHFSNKEAIWQAVMEWVANRLLARVDKAADSAATPLGALEAIFMTHIEFVSAHPGVPRMLFGELQHSGESTPKLMARTLLQKYGQRLAILIEQGKIEGEIDPSISTYAACQVFIGAIQGLVIQSLIGDKSEAMKDKAPGVFAIVRQGIEIQS
jgi:AcrR family transcriptional regulator